MRKIEVDNEVFACLQKMAEPFVDTPNMVLRKLLLGDQGERRVLPLPKIDDRVRLMKHIKENYFEGGFKRVRPYQLMFKSDKYILYFQNFEKLGTPTLWYRIKQKAIDILEEFGDGAFLVLTNPAENCAYIIPIAEIVKKMTEFGWDRRALEVNINHKDSLWIEFKWDIGAYYQEFKF